MEWTQERVEQLMTLWLEGLSASQIAAQMGGVSRNAVIGKVHRLKLSGRARAVKPAANARAAVRQGGEVKAASVLSLAEKREEKTGKKVAEKLAEKPTATAPDSPKARTGAVAVEGVRPVAAKKEPTVKKADILEPETAAETVLERGEDNVVALEPRPRSDEDVVVPMSRRLTLLQLTEKTCKWPIGDPLQGNFYFCGADACEGNPYCRYHSKIAFQPVADRRRLRA